MQEIQDFHFTIFTNFYDNCITSVCACTSDYESFTRKNNSPEHTYRH